MLQASITINIRENSILSPMRLHIRHCHADLAWLCCPLKGHQAEHGYKPAITSIQVWHHNLKGGC